MGGPILPASGRVMRLGTKKTGNHLANKAAPGLSSENNLPPTGSNSMVAKRAQHPPKDEGKEIAKARNSLRKATSNAINKMAEPIESVKVGDVFWLEASPLTEEEEAAAQSAVMDGEDGGKVVTHAGFDNERPPSLETNTCWYPFVRAESILATCGVAAGKNALTTIDGDNRATTSVSRLLAEVRNCILDICCKVLGTLDDNVRSCIDNETERLMREPYFMVDRHLYFAVDSFWHFDDLTPMTSLSFLKSESGFGLNGSILLRTLTDDNGSLGRVLYLGPPFFMSKYISHIIHLYMLQCQKAKDSAKWFVAGWCDCPYCTFGWLASRMLICVMPLVGACAWWPHFMCRHFAISIGT